MEIIICGDFSDDVKKIDITKTISKETFLICFEKDALGLDMPSEETRISQNHLIF